MGPCRGTAAPVRCGKRQNRSGYLRQGGCVIVAVCLFVCLSISNFAQKRPNGFA